jgi:hypothetical protein
MKKTGVDEGPIVRTLAYLILATLRVYSPAHVAELLRVALTGPKGEPLPKKVIDFLLMPLLDSLLGDLQLVCSSECKRFSRDESLRYWAKRHFRATGRGLVSGELD